MTTIAFKTTLEQKAFIREQAEARNTSISAFIRAAIDKMKPRQRSRIVRKNGHLVVMLPPGCRPITDADLAAEEEEYIQNL